MRDELQGKKSCFFNLFLKVFCRRWAKYKVLLTLLVYLYLYEQHVSPISTIVFTMDCLLIAILSAQKCRRPTGHADGASLNWHGKWSGCVALQQLRCPPSLDSSEVTSTSQAARRTTTVSLATPCRQRRGPTDASLGHRQKHGQHSKKIKSPKVAKDCPEVAPSSQKISSISHRLCHLLRF